MSQEDRTMAEDKSKRGPQDGKLISMTEDYEVEYWTKKFGVSKEQLAVAVKSVGHSAAAVEKHLAEHDRANEGSVHAASKLPSP
jgi:hypothetical protein